MRSSNTKVIARRLPMTVFVVLSVLYMIGGVGGLREAGSRIREWFAPTALELRRPATESAAPVVPGELPAQPARLRNSPLSEPLPGRDQLLIVGGIIVAAVAFMFLTGRGSARHS